MNKDSNVIDVNFSYEYPIASKVLKDGWAGLDNIYSEFLHKNHPSQKDDQELYIYDLGKSSIILKIGAKQEELFWEDSIQLEFFDALVSISEAIEIKDYNKLPQWVSVSTISNFGKLIKHIPTKSTNKFIVSAKDRDVFQIDYTKSKEIIATIPECKKELQKESSNTNIKYQVRMIWLQNNHNKDNADTVIISEIDLKSYKITFQNIDDKVFCKHYNSEMKEDWQNISFLADVEVIYGTKKGITRYHVLKVYQDKCQIADRNKLFF